MKKVLEGELISLAHSILKLKNRADIFELKEKAHALYEKLSILAYAEKHFDGPQPTLGKKEFIAFIKDEISIEEPNLSVEASHISEESKTVINQEPNIEEDISAENTSVKEPTQSEEVVNLTVKETEKEDNSSKVEEDFGVHYDQLPQFEPLITEEKFVVTNEGEAKEKVEVKKENNKEDLTKEEIKTPLPLQSSEALIQTEEIQAPVKEEAVVPPQKTMDLFSQNKKSLNDQLRKGIKIGLNDRLAFMKHLFGNDVADYNRVLSQLNTFSSPEEAITFINEAVKPSYQNWENKEEYETRFVAAVVARFE